MVDRQEQSKLTPVSDGMWFLPPEGEVRTDYYRDYATRGSSHFSWCLLKTRLDLVRMYELDDSVLVDLGIGDGSFIELRNLRADRSTWGIDIDVKALQWLQKAGLLWDNGQPIPSATFWDSLEHMANPLDVLNRVQKTVFASIPIFTGYDHIVSSRHFKPNEHLWYFTEDGFISFMARAGFGLRHVSRQETLIGREDIGTFVFRRRA